MKQSYKITKWMLAVALVVATGVSGCSKPPEKTEIDTTKKTELKVEEEKANSAPSVGIVE